MTARHLAMSRVIWLAMLFVIFSHALLPDAFRPAPVSGSAFSAATAENAILPQQRSTTVALPALPDREPSPLPVSLLALLVMGLCVLLAGVTGRAAPPWPAPSPRRPLQRTTAHAARAPPLA